MKVAPVSADLLIKIALCTIALGAIYYGVRRAKTAIESSWPAGLVRDVSEAYESATTTAGQVWRGVSGNFTQPLDERVSGYELNQAYDNGVTDNRKYDNPLISNDGVNYGLF